MCREARRARNKIPATSRKSPQASFRFLFPEPGTVREAGTSRRHGAPVEDPLKPLNTIVLGCTGGGEFRGTLNRALLINWLHKLRRTYSGSCQTETRSHSVFILWAQFLFLFCRSTFIFPQLNKIGLGYFRRRHFRRMHFRRRHFRRMEHWSNGTLVEWNIGRM